LMTLIGMLHNLSRSVGCAMLVVTDKNLLFAFFGGEVLLNFLYRIIRGDFIHAIRLDGVVGFMFSFNVRCVVKIIADFTGCFHMRNSCELGGLAFSSSMLWAQIFPFVALTFVEDNENKEAITIFLACK